MAHTNWQERIVIDGELHHGDPCIRGTRVPVRTIIGSLADGSAVEEILAAYPQLDRHDVQAALAYAAEMMREESFIPLLQAV